MVCEAVATMPHIGHPVLGANEAMTRLRISWMLGLRSCGHDQALVPSHTCRTAQSVAPSLTIQHVTLFLMPTHPDPAPTVVAVFDAFRADLDDYNDRRERLIKVCLV